MRHLEEHVVAEEEPPRGEELGGDEEEVVVGAVAPLVRVEEDQVEGPRRVAVLGQARQRVHGRAHHLWRRWGR